jgi:hypothetical protein
MTEITDTDLSAIRADLSVCSPLVQSLVMRLDRVEEQLDLAKDTEEGLRAGILDLSRLCGCEDEPRFKWIRLHISSLKTRISELTQCDPSWYDASPADAFMLLKKAQERVKVLEAVLAEAVNYLRSSHHHPAARTFEAALKEGE